MSGVEAVELVESFPDVPTYRRLRVETGLSPKSQDAATRGLANTLYGVSLLKAGEVIGMGRVVGDGGTVFVVVDVAVRRDHQGQGLGKRIMAAPSSAQAIGMGISKLMAKASSKDKTVMPDAARPLHAPKHWRPKRLRTLPVWPAPNGHRARQARAR